MDTKFTPGPWSAETDMDGRHHYIAILAGGKDFYADAKWPYHPLIASAHHGRGSAPREIAEANAKLIAAAPDMYEALIWAKKLIEAIVIQRDIITDPVEITAGPIMKTIEAALAKVQS